MEFGIIRIRVRVMVMVRVRGGDVFPQADPQCIDTQQMHTNHIIGGLWIESCHVIDSIL